MGVAFIQKSYEKPLKYNTKPPIKGVKHSKSDTMSAQIYIKKAPHVEDAGVTQKLKLNLHL
jgi:hypothetical protein